MVTLRVRRSEAVVLFRAIEPRAGEDVQLRPQPIRRQLGFARAVRFLVADILVIESGGQSHFDSLCYGQARVMNVQPL